MADMDVQENNLDELMMNLFSVIAGSVRNRQELFDNEGSIMQSLLDVGFRLHEADAALMLMQTLVRKQTEKFFGPDQTGRPHGVRTMNSEERRRFTMEAFAFVVKLSHLGVLSEDQREELLERAMAFYKDRIELEHIKPLVAFILFSGKHERSGSDVSYMGIKDTAWT